MKFLSYSAKTKDNTKILQILENLQNQKHITEIDYSFIENKSIQLYQFIIYILEYFPNIRIYIKIKKFVS